MATERAAAAARLTPPALPASAPALVTPEQTPPARPLRPLVHFALGDVELRADAAKLADALMQPMAGMLAANILVATGLRTMALAAYPVIRKIMRQVKPDYPQPDIPRGADPALYLATYLLTVAQTYLLEWHWTLDYHARQDGALELVGARPDARMDATDHATDGTDDPLGAGMDTPDAEPIA